MGNYGASRFAEAAGELPSGLAVQLRKQLGITPEQFLADGQAAADAGKVIASLRADGVTVLDAKLKGTTLTVTVPDAADVAAAEADGANALIGTAQPVKTVRAKAVSSPANGSSDLLGGDLWFYFTDTSTGAGVVCSTGFNGYDESTGAEELLTAGHCADYQDTGDPAPANGVVYVATDTDPVTLDAGVPVQDPSLGSLDQSSFHFGSGEDSGVVDVTDTEAKPVPAVNTWGSGDTDADPGSTASQGVENSGGTVPVLAAAAAIAGEPVCHSGERTGWQCGTVEDAFVTADVEAATETQTVDGMETSVCILPGDSGGSFVSGEYAVGVASASNFSPESSSGSGDNNCSGSGYSIAYPMVAAASGEESAAASEPDFELAVSVPTPVVTTATADVVTGDGTISGDLPAPFATGTPVSLSLDGETTASTTADSSGDWSFSLAGLADGTHSYTVTAGSGYSTRSTSGTLSIGQVTISGTAQNGKTLTAAVTGVPSDGTVAYQWSESGKAVGTGQTYLLTDGDVGQALTVTATVTEGANSVSVTSAPTAVVAPGTLTAGTPIITGSARVGEILTAVPGTWSPANGLTFAYQWDANGTPVTGATNSAFTVPGSLVGYRISVAVTASATGYSPSTATSAATAAIAPGNFTDIKVPGISGTVKVGSKVVASSGTWSVAAPTFTYQWLDNGKRISGATNASFTIPASLAGEKLSVTVTAHKIGYNNSTKTSTATTVAKGTLTVEVKPKLSGTPEVGKKLAVTKGTWNSAPAITIQWYANGKPVPHATGTSLELTADLKGETVSVTITASKAGYVTATVRLTESTRVKSDA